jgi:methyl-accepting chemotaxis protein
MIETLQSGTRSAVGVMDQGLNTAKRTIIKANQAVHSLGNIVRSVSTITRMNGQIASAADEHSKVAEQIDRAVVHISQLSDEASLGTQKTADESTAMARLSEELRSLVRQFKL